MPRATKPAPKTAFVWEEGRDESVYRGDSLNSVSNSEKEVFRRSPELYYATFVDKSVEPQRSPALDIGGGLHSRVLLPVKDDPIVPIPIGCLTSDGKRNTRGEAWREFVAANPGKYLLTDAECEAVDRMRSALLEHPIAGSFLSYGLPELPAKALDPVSGLWLRCRYDWLTEASDGSALNADLKTYGGDVGDRRALSGHILRFGYDRQLAFYRAIHRAAFGRDCRCLLIFVEKKPPHRVQAIELGASWLAKADAQNAGTLLAMKAARESCDFTTPGINDVLLLERPRWADFQDEYAVE